MIDQGFREITLVDMGDTSGPDVSIADLSTPVAVANVSHVQSVLAAAGVGTTATQMQKAISRISS